MMNTGHLIKVGVAWVSIVYVVCFVGVALFPSLRQQLMLYALHTDVSTGQNVMTLTTFGLDHGVGHPMPFEPSPRLVVED